MKSKKNLLSFLRSGLLRLSVVNLLLPRIISMSTNVPTSAAMSIFENVSMTTVEIIEKSGYTAEIHKVVTEDGFVLEMHRIPMSKSGQMPTRNHPVFFHHGILGSSADWVLGGPEKSLAMQLADAGYDVWMTNSRGNTYSRHHVTLNYRQKAFWDFCLQDIGIYDVPAALDYILMETNKTQVHYIGFSMGTSVFFIMASEKPAYQSKIRSQISLAPVVFLANTRTSLRFMAPLAKMMNIIIQRTSKGMFMPQSKMQTFLASTLCKEKFTQKYICERCIIFSVCGSDPYEFDSRLIPQIMGHFPAGTSSKLATHFAQFYLKGIFGQFDYGATLNMRHYNSTVPPKYDLKSVKVPVTLIYGKNDIIADLKDVMKLKEQLPNLMDAIQVSNPYCNHVDLMWSLNVTEQVNNPVKEILQKTDRLDWSYTGPCSSATDVLETASTDNRKENEKTVSLLPKLTNAVRFSAGIDFFAENLDAIIASTMPQSLNDADTVDFERERELQKAMFANVINVFKADYARFYKLQDDITNEISDWTGYVAVGVVTGVTDTHNAIETHMKNTQTLINDQVNVVVDKVAVTGNVVAGTINKAENTVSNSIGTAENVVVTSVGKVGNTVSNSIGTADNVVVTSVGKVGNTVSNSIGTAEHYVVTSVSKVGNTVSNSIGTAEHYVVTSVGKVGNTVSNSIGTAEHYVVTSVGKAEQSVVGSISKAENFVNSGLNKANQAVSGAFDTTFKSLNKAFWFFK